MIGLDYILGVAPTMTLRRHIEGLEASTKARFEAAPKEGKARRFMSSSTGPPAGAASSGSSPVWRPARKGRHTLHRHQSEGPQRPCTLRGCLLPARPGGKPYQVLEDASGGRPHLVHQGHGQPAPAVPARRRILAHVGSARV